MDCQQAQQELLMADDPATLPAELAAHVAGCADCQAMARRVMALQGAARSLPVSGHAEAPPPLVMERLMASRRRARGGCFRMFKGALAAAVVVAAGLLAVTMLTSSPPVQGQTVITDLVRWDLQIAAEHDPAARTRLFQQSAGAMKQKIAALSEADRTLAQSLMDAAEKLAGTDDPLANTHQLVDIADQLRARLDAGKADSTIQTVYQDVVRQGIDPTLQRVPVNTLSAEQKLDFEHLRNQAGRHLAPLPPVTPPAPPIPGTQGASQGAPTVAPALAHDTELPQQAPGVLIRTAPRPTATPGTTSSGTSGAPTSSGTSGISAASAGSEPGESHEAPEPANHPGRTPLPPVLAEHTPDGDDPHPSATTGHAQSRRPGASTASDSTSSAASGATASAGTARPVHLRNPINEDSGTCEAPPISSPTATGSSGGDFCTDNPGTVVVAAGEAPVDPRVLHEWQRDPALRVDAPKQTADEPMDVSADTQDVDPPRYAGAADIPDAQTSVSGIPYGPDMSAMFGDRPRMNRPGGPISASTRPVYGLGGGTATPGVSFSVTPSGVPEPATGLLALAGITMLLIRRRRG